MICALKRARFCLHLCLFFAVLKTTFAAPVGFPAAVRLAKEQAQAQTQPGGDQVLGGIDCFDVSAESPGLPGVDLDQDLSRPEAERPTGANEGAQPSAPEAGAESNRLEAKQLPQSAICTAALRAATIYTQLAWDQFQVELVHREHETAQRLVTIEKKRIVAAVDGEIPLFRAEFLEAHSRARELRLEEEIDGLQFLLAKAIGFPNGPLTATLDSIPEMPSRALQATENRLAGRAARKEREVQLSIASLRATRDTLQLVYMLAERDAARTAGLGKATIGEELQAQIRSDDKLADLLQVSAELQCARLRFLDMAGVLEDWAESVKLAPAEKNPRAAFHPVGKASPPLLLPSNGSLRARQSMQLAAISTGIGGGKDVTGTVEWSSSNDAVAIVSSAGLITALRPGTSTIAACYGPAVKEKVITVTETDQPSRK